MFDEPFIEVKEIVFLQDEYVWKLFQILLKRVQ